MTPQTIIVTGCDTEIGKTTSCAILAWKHSLLYWKPVECGPAHDLDSVIMEKFLKESPSSYLAPQYQFTTPCSPHLAAQYENRTIDTSSIYPPKKDRPLLVETAGGIFAPLTASKTNLDVFSTFNGGWIVVTKHYLGSLNHTLMTLDILQKTNQHILGIIINGEPDKEYEKPLFNRFQIPLLGRIFPEKSITKSIIKRYASSWQQLQL
jgi:dethiobiotin synthetase